MLEHEQEIEDGFRHNRERKAFAKFMLYANMYHESPDWDEDIISYTEVYACSQIRKMGVSNDWTSWTGSYDNLKSEFLSWYRSR